MTQRPPEHDGGEDDLAEGTPRWVKAVAALAVLAALLVVVLLLAGGHGPGRHSSATDASDAALPSG